MRRNRTRRPLAVLLAGTFLLVAAGCSAAGASRVPEGGSAPEAAPSAAPENDGAMPADGGPAQGGPASVEDRKIIRTASVDVVVKGVEDAAADLRSIALSVGGLISAESLSLPKDPADTDYGYSTVVVSVPASRLDQALAAIAEIGEVRQRTIDSTDVTDTVVDTESRIKTMRASITRLQALMSKAGSVDDIASVESELTQRESELEAMLAKLNSLNHQVELSPITVTLRTPEAVAAEPPSGFLAGLQTGWDSIRTVGQVALTVLGVLLPYLVVAAIIIVPLVLWRRRNRVGGPRPGQQVPAPAHPGMSVAQPVPPPTQPGPATVEPGPAATGSRPDSPPQDEAQK